MKKLLTWLAAIIGAIIAGVIVWLVTTAFVTGPGPGSSEPQPIAPKPQSFLEKVSGSYSLVSWDEASGPITMGVGVKDGTLHIDQNGEANWELWIWDSAAHPDPPAGSTQSRIKCVGRVSGSSQQLTWVPDADRNDSIDWEPGIASVEDMVWPAFCGGHSAGTDAPFALHLDEQASGRDILEMSNSEGTFTWTR